MTFRITKIKGDNPGNNFIYVHSDGGLKIIDTVQYNIQDGKGYRAAHRFTAVADNASKDVLVQVGATKTPHTLILVSNEGDSHLDIYEGTTISSSGSALGVFNKNRQSSGTSETNIFHTPTVSSTGTVINNIFLPGGRKNSATGNNSLSQSEWMLKKSTNYLVRITNKSGAVIDMSTEIEYYEG